VDDGLVLDLSAMKGVRVDPERKRLVAQAGNLSQDLDIVTAARARTISPVNRVLTSWPSPIN
jgi:hypothetical protein